MSGRSSMSAISPRVTDKEEAIDGSEDGTVSNDQDGDGGDDMNEGNIEQEVKSWR